MGLLVKDFYVSTNRENILTKVSHVKFAETVCIVNTGDELLFRCY
jgi:hypothetical protein